MNHRPVPSDLTPAAAGYLVRMRSLERPVDLVDRIMREVESTPQARRGLAALPMPVLIAGAVAAVVLAVAILLQVAQPNIGPQPSPTPTTTQATVLQRVPTISTYSPATFGRGYLWLEDSQRGQLIRVEPDTGVIDDPISVTGDSVAGGLHAAVSLTSIWVVDNSTLELVEIDPESNQEFFRIRTNVLATGLAVVGDVAWMVDAGAESVARVDLVKGVVDLRIPFRAPMAIQSNGSEVWVVDIDGMLTTLDAATGEVAYQVPTGVPAVRAVWNGDTVLISGFGGVLVSVDVNNRTVSGRRTEGGVVAVGDGRVWTDAAGSIVELDPKTLEPISVLALGPIQPHGLVFGAGSLWTVGIDASGKATLLEIEPGQHPD
jgi:outer membrane protein assembly factor BamB